MKASHHNFKTKQQAVEVAKHVLACFASFGLRSLRIGLQRVSKPSTTTLKLTKATARPPDPWSSPIPKFLVTSCQSLSFGAWLRLLSEQSKASAHEDPNGGKKQIGLRRSPAPTSECMQMNRCQGRKASRSVPSNRLFPMVTVTNDSQNRSTLNSCNFAVP